MKDLHKKLLDLGLQYTHKGKGRNRPFFGYIVENDQQGGLKIDIGKTRVILSETYNIDIKLRQVTIFRIETFKQSRNDIGCFGEISLDDLFQEIKKEIYQIHGYDEKIAYTQKQIITFLLCKKFPKDIGIMIGKMIWENRFF